MILTLPKIQSLNNSQKLPFQGNINPNTDKISEEVSGYTRFLIFGLKTHHILSIAFFGMDSLYHPQLRRAEKKRDLKTIISSTSDDIEEKIDELLFQRLTKEIKTLKEIHSHSWDQINYTQFNTQNILSVLFSFDILTKREYLFLSKLQDSTKRLVGERLLSISNTVKDRVMKENHEIIELDKVQKIGPGVFIFKK